MVTGLFCPVQKLESQIIMVLTRTFIYLFSKHGPDSRPFSNPNFHTIFGPFFFIYVRIRIHLFSLFRGERTIDGFHPIHEETVKGRPNIGEDIYYSLDQCCGSVWIRLDPFHFEETDPDPGSKKNQPNSLKIFTKINQNH